MSLPENKPVMTGRKRRSIAWAATGVTVLLSVILAFVFRSFLLTAVAEGLIVNDSPHPADIIFLLNGDYNTRPFRAAELYDQKLAPLVVIARSEDTPAVTMGLIPNETDISVSILKKKGVPPDKIVVLSWPGGVTSTFDEAAALHQYVNITDISRIILVTSEFHSRRAKWIFERELSGLPVTLEMVAVPYSTFDKTSWWKNENGLITLNNEYIKLVYYYFKYR
jgi:uncharacterized SAM-binding protein YcdF (DUF218 family)